MYTTDVVKIRRSFENQPGDTLEHVVRFVLATIQQRFHTVPLILDEWDRLGTKAPTMFGSKRRGVRYIAKRKHDIAAQLLSADRVAAIDILLTIPGLGVIKASFVAQMLGFDVGCIDTHNARMYGVKVASFNVNNKHTAKTRLAKIKAYCAMCDGLGGTKHLWDTWCELIADTQSVHFTDAIDVSEMHSTQVFRYFEQDEDRF
jgi:hypothetical protein